MSHNCPTPFGSTYLTAKKIWPTVLKNMLFTTLDRKKKYSCRTNILASSWQMSSMSAPLNMYYVTGHKMLHCYGQQKLKKCVTDQLNYLVPKRQKTHPFLTDKYLLIFYLTPLLEYFFNGTSGKTSYLFPLNYGILIQQK